MFYYKFLIIGTFDIILQVLKGRLESDSRVLALQREVAVLEAELDTVKLREEGRERQREELVREMADSRVKLQSQRQQHMEEMRKLQQENTDK